MDQRKCLCQGHSPHDHYDHAHFDLMPEPTHRHPDLEQIVNLLLLGVFLVALLVMGLHIIFYH